MNAARDPRGRRERERARVRLRILDVARELFATEGIGAVTMRRIAEALEYTPGALYRHFPDKAALLESLVTVDYASFNEGFDRLARVANPVDRIRRAGDAYVAFGLAHPHHYRLLFMTSLEELPGTPVDLDPRKDSYEFMRVAVRDAKSAGLLLPGLSDVEAVTQVLWAGVHGVVSLAITHRAGMPLRSARSLARLMGDVLIRGLFRNAPTRLRRSR